MTDKTRKLVFYKLDGKNVVACDSPIEAIESNSEEAVRVGLTETDYTSISTVFLGVPHSSRSGVKCQFFETYVFPKNSVIEDNLAALPDNPIQFGVLSRYDTWAEAEDGHEKIVALIKEQETLVVVNVANKPIH